MSTSITQADIRIPFIDNDGVERNLTIKECNVLTGKRIGTIHYHYKSNKEGRISITNRQIVGLDKYSWKNPGRPIQIRANLDEVRTAFNRRKLV